MLCSRTCVHARGPQHQAHDETAADAGGDGQDDADAGQQHGGHEDVCGAAGGADGRQRLQNQRKSTCTTATQHTGLTKVPVAAADGSKINTI